MDQVIERATIRPTRIYNFGADLGSLRPGSVTDITVLEVRQDSFQCTDSTGKKRTGRQKLQSAAAVRAAIRAGHRLRAERGESGSGSRNGVFGKPPRSRNNHWPGTLHSGAVGCILPVVRSEENVS